MYYQWRAVYIERCKYGLGRGIAETCVCKGVRLAYSTGTAGLLRPPRILLCGLPSTHGLMKPFPKSSASCGTSSRTDELEVKHYG